MAEGTIINIQKYSVHDGPGIRTTTFFKGCPLNCWWCHNPETHLKRHEIMFFEDRCTGCGRCVKNCSNGAIEIIESKAVVDDEKCTLCGRCSEVCINEGRELVGRDITVNELMKELIKDQMFYEQSNGGVTFSGGEPMLYEDIKYLIGMLKNKGYHITVETNGTIYRKTSCDLVSISPKLKHSGNDSMNLKTIYPDVINQYINNNGYQLKFVVRDFEEDFNEVKEILKELPQVNYDKVLIMALSSSKADLERVQKQVIRLCIQNNLRYTTRLQLHVWDGENEI